MTCYIIIRDDDAIYFGRALKLLCIYHRRYGVALGSCEAPRCGEDLGKCRAGLWPELSDDPLMVFWPE